MTPIWISLLIVSFIIASFIGGVFAAKRIRGLQLPDDFDDLADPYLAPKNPTAAVKELKRSYVVIANINGLEVAIKKFPKDDSPRLAQISAEELADEIMND